MDRNPTSNDSQDEVLERDKSVGSSSMGPNQQAMVPPMSTSPAPGRVGNLRRPPGSVFTKKYFYAHPTKMRRRP